MLFRLLLLPIAVVTILSLSPQETRAHSWYPIECCHDKDCAPVDQVLTGAGDGMTVQTRHGVAKVPITMPLRESKDHRMHVCMRPGDNGGMRVICVFLPPAY